MDTLLIYIRENNPRLDYIVELIFSGIMGIPYDKTCNRASFLSYSGPRLNYSTQTINDIPCIYAHDFLFSNKIEPVSADLLRVEYVDSIPVFFITHGSKQILPFDIFSASFYLVSRYEEYLPFSKDLHGRFPWNESFAYKNGFLDKPVVNQWVKMLYDKLLKIYPGLKSVKKQTFTFQPTIDVDSVFEFKGKGLFRTAGGLARDVIHRNISDIKDRLSVLAGISRDRFDNLDEIIRLHKKNHIKPIFFFLVSKYGQYNKNISPSNRHFRHIIQRVAGEYEIGLHPGYQKKMSLESLKKEKQTLEDITGREITKSRHHFLKIHLPETYDNLTQAGIREDYSMGFAGQPGFRAGTATPFFFYHLEKETTTNLKIYPITYMDVTLYEYLQMKPEDALITIKKLVDVVNESEGLCISLWHNESLSEKGHWKGWKTIYEQSIFYIFEK